MIRLCRCGIEYHNPKQTTALPPVVRVLDVQLDSLEEKSDPAVAGKRVSPPPPETYFGQIFLPNDLKYWSIGRRFC